MEDSVISRMQIYNKMRLLLFYKENLEQMNFLRYAIEKILENHFDYDGRNISTKIIAIMMKLSTYDMIMFNENHRLG